MTTTAQSNQSQTSHWNIPCIRSFIGDHLKRIGEAEVFKFCLTSLWGFRFTSTRLQLSSKSRIDIYRQHICNLIENEVGYVELSRTMVEAAPSCQETLKETSKYNIACMKMNERYIGYLRHPLVLILLLDFAVVISLNYSKPSQVVNYDITEPVLEIWQMGRAQRTCSEWRRLTRISHVKSIPAREERGERNYHSTINITLISPATKTAV